MTTTSIDLETLRALTAIAAHGSVGAAATALGHSQQALSARMRAAERRLGHPLLHRSHRGSTLTPNGELVVEWGAALLAAEAAFDTATDMLFNPQHDALVIAASQSISEAFMPSWIAASRQHGDGVVQLRSGNSAWVVDQIRTGTATLGFIETPDIPADLDTLHIGTDAVAIVTAPDHPWAARTTPLPWHELASTPLVLREAGSGTRATLERALDDMDLALQTPAAELSSTGAIRTAIAGELAPGAISRALVHDDISTGALIEIPLDETLQRPLTALWKGILTANAMRFLEAIRR